MCRCTGPRAAGAAAETSLIQLRGIRPAGTRQGRNKQGFLNSRSSPSPSAWPKRTNANISRKKQPYFLFGIKLADGCGNADTHEEEGAWGFHHARNLFLNFTPAVGSQEQIYLGRRKQSVEPSAQLLRAEVSRGLITLFSGDYVSGNLFRKKCVKEL